MLPPFKNEFTKAQINQINKAYQSGGRLVFKPTRKQIEGGSLSTLASIGIPMAISLVSKIFGSGLQVDRQASTNTRNVYVPQAPVKTRGEGHYPIYQSQPLFWKLGKSNWSWGKMGRGLLLGKNSAFSSIPIIGSFCKQPLSNFDLFDWAKKKKTWNKIFQRYFQQRYITKKDWKRVWNSQS